MNVVYVLLLDISCCLLIVSIASSAISAGGYNNGYSNVVQTPTPTITFSPANSPVSLASVISFATDVVYSVYINASPASQNAFTTSLCSQYKRTLSAAINSDSVTVGSCIVTTIVKGSSVVNLTTLVAGDSKNAALHASKSEGFVTSLTTAFQSDSVLKTYVGSSSLLVGAASAIILPSSPTSTLSKTSYTTQNVVFVNAATTSRTNNLPITMLAVNSGVLPPTSLIGGVDLYSGMWGRAVTFSQYTSQWLFSAWNSLSSPAPLVIANLQNALAITDDTIVVVAWVNQLAAITISQSDLWDGSNRGVPMNKTGLIIGNYAETGLSYSVMCSNSVSTTLGSINVASGSLVRQVVTFGASDTWSCSVSSNAWILATLQFDVTTSALADHFLALIVYQDPMGKVSLGVYSSTATIRMTVPLYNTWIVQSFGVTNIASSSDMWQSAASQHSTTIVAANTMNSTSSTLSLTGTFESVSSLAVSVNVTVSFRSLPVLGWDFQNFDLGVRVLWHLFNGSIGISSVLRLPSYITLDLNGSTLLLNGVDPVVVPKWVMPSAASWTPVSGGSPSSISSTSLGIMFINLISSPQSLTFTCEGLPATGLGPVLSIKTSVSTGETSQFQLSLNGYSSSYTELIPLICGGMSDINPMNPKPPLVNFECTAVNNVGVNITTTFVLLPWVSFGGALTIVATVDVDGTTLGLAPFLNRVGSVRILPNDLILNSGSTWFFITNVISPLPSYSPNRIPLGCAMQQPSWIIIFLLLCKQIFY